jgi:uncharacterized protein YjeT (DUF2065 family)
MRGQEVLGLVLVIVGLVLLFLLRSLVLRIIIFLIEFLGIVVALVLIALGIGLLLWPGRRSNRIWRRDI